MLTTQKTVFDPQPFHPSHKESQVVLQPSSHTDEEWKTSEIQRFYSGSNVFITGGTGFMGKVLIEKLLRSCPDVRTVYVMVREKKGKKIEERVEEMISKKLFDRVRSENPTFHTKIRAIAGDVSAEGLAISQQDRLILQREVNIVFHMAATVRFDQDLRTAILMNVRGTRDILKLCRTFTQLKCVIHVSTAYSNCPRSKVNEVIYDPPYPTEQLIHLAEHHDTLTVNHLTHKLVGSWPNTYTFTKAISEDAVKVYGAGLPVAVFRPSIVVGTNKEPVGGWIDNLFGPTGLVVGSVSGIIRALLCDPDSEANMVPCDMAINALIASSWEVAVHRTQESCPVYNYVCPKDNQLKWGRYKDAIESLHFVCPLSQTLGYAEIYMTRNYLLYNLMVLFLHMLPAVFIDTYLLMTTGRTKLVKVCAKVYRFTEVLSYFMLRQWEFETSNTDHLLARLNSVDKELFQFNMDQLDWHRYICTYCRGVRQFIVEDPDDNIPKAVEREKRMYFYHNVLKFGLVVLAFKIFNTFWEMLY